MVQEGVVLGHKISEKGIQVDKAKLEVIEKLDPPTTVKGVRCFLGHAGFDRDFAEDGETSGRVFATRLPSVLGKRKELRQASSLNHREGKGLT